MNKNTYIKVTKQNAVKLVLSNQLLTTNNKNVLDIIESLSYIQIDTISVICRAHHHIIWTRFNNYKENIINKLLEEDKSIFEYWSHAASYLPMKDYRFSLIRKEQYLNNKKHWFEQDPKLKKYILDKIKIDGEVQSKDFEAKDNKYSGWFNWKPAKKALEQLFMEGLIMVSKRKGFQKVYDLTERVLPSNTDVSMPTIKEYCNYLINSSIKSQGLVQESEINYLRNNFKNDLKEEINFLERNNQIIRVKVEGLEDLDFFSSEENINNLDKIKEKNYIHFLSPFDNLIIQRKRLKNLFDFDYILECYIPEPKRKYGYFCLPILFNNNIVGKFDSKVDRKNKIFYIKSIYFEDFFQVTDEFKDLFNNKLQEFASFNGCQEIILETQL